MFWQNKINLDFVKEPTFFLLEVCFFATSEDGVDPFISSHRHSIAL